MKKQGSMIEWAMKNKAFPLALAFIFVVISNGNFCGIARSIAIYAS